jgi:Fe-S-cluster-containing dehydrogenase component
LAICPTKAVRKRRDGIVLVDEEKCIGCKYCIWACPYGAPQFDEDKKAVRKCTLCVHRMDKGLKPSCASHCPAKAIYLCDLNELAKITRGKHMIGEGVVRFAITTP